jgi:hypothetical protein
MLAPDEVSCQLLEIYPGARSARRANAVANRLTIASTACKTERQAIRRRGNLA